MPQSLGGPGVPLPAPRLLYPATLAGVAVSAPTFEVNIPTGGVLPIPAGKWLISWPTGAMLQWYDGWCTGQWINYNAVYPINGATTGTAGVNSGANATGFATIQSDGVNFRIANLTGTAWAALVTAAGSGYAQATTIVTPSAGNSSWMPIIGGALGAFTVVAGGAGYSKPPLVLIDKPPMPGVPGVATATLSGGAVNAITAVSTQIGAGYLTAPRVTIVPDPADPNFLNGSITSQATATVALTGSGTLTAVLLQNFGTSQGSGITLTVAGAGSSATAATVPAAGSIVTQAATTVIIQQMP